MSDFDSIINFAKATEAIPEQTVTTEELVRTISQDVGHPNGAAHPQDIELNLHLMCERIRHAVRHGVLRHRVEEIIARAFQEGETCLKN